MSIEVIRRVYDDTEGVFIEIAPGDDGYGISIRTKDKESVDFFGKIDFFLYGKEYIGKFLTALNAAYEEME